MRGVGGSKMNTAFIHDLLDWIDNNLDSRLTLKPSPGEPAIRNGISSGSSKNILPLAEYIRAQKLQNRLSA